MDVEGMSVRLNRAFVKEALLEALGGEIGKLREPTRLS